MIGEALELRHRLPRLWALTRREELPVWQARMIARDTTMLSKAAALFVDRQLAAVGGHRVGPAQLRRTIAAAIAEHMPDLADRRASEAVERRKVEIDFDRNGTNDAMVQVSAILSHPDGVDLEHAVREGAAALRAGGSTDSLNVRRATALGDIARHQPSLGFTNTADAEAETATASGRTVPGDHDAAPATSPAAGTPVADGTNDATSDRGSGQSAGVGGDASDSRDDATAGHGEGDQAGAGAPVTAGGAAGNHDRDDGVAHAAGADANADGGVDPEVEWPAAYRQSATPPSTIGAAGTIGAASTASTASTVGKVGTVGRELVIYVIIDPVTGVGEAGTQRIPLCAETLRQWCGAPATTRITLKPVIDLNEPLTTQAYQVPARLKEHVALRDRRCCFPYCDRAAHPVPSRTGADGVRAYGTDTDHIIAYQHDDSGGGDGPTHTSNLAALCRRHHRIKHDTAWCYTMLRPGVFVWVDPSGHPYLRTRLGTTDLGPPGTTPA